MKTLARFDATARCDRCGARAYLRAFVGSAGELLFCSHHGREFHAALVDAGASIEVDDR